MRYKMFALILALTVATWAQTSTQTTPATPQRSTVPADKAMCDKMSGGNSKDAHSCCAHHAMKSDIKAEDGKATASCCTNKDATADSKNAMSCMKNDKDKTAASCCKDGCGKDSCAKEKTAAACCSGKCAKDGEKSCCSGMKSEKTAKSCCTKEMHS
jgi:hypothetical protein